MRRPPKRYTSRADNRLRSLRRKMKNDNPFRAWIDELVDIFAFLLVGTLFGGALGTLLSHLLFYVVGFAVIIVSLFGEFEFEPSKFEAAKSFMTFFGAAIGACAGLFMKFAEPK